MVLLRRERLIPDDVLGPSDLVLLDAGLAGAPDQDVAGWLDSADADLAVIHDENQSPSLDPTSAGEVMEISIPASRLQTCADAQELAREAEGEAKKDSPDYDYIGDRTRTLEATYTAAIRVKFEF